jgi:hypothetical protein
MIKITVSRPHKTLRQKDVDFTFSPDGIRLVPRASFEINDKCPTEYKQMLMTAFDLGWIKPVAHMRDTEYTMELLKK